MQAEFSLVNCPLSHPSPDFCSRQMPSDNFKNHLRNIKYYLLKVNLDSCSNLYNKYQSNFQKSKTMWYAWCLAQAVGNSL